MKRTVQASVLKFLEKKQKTEINENTQVNEPEEEEVSGSTIIQTTSSSLDVQK